MRLGALILYLLLLLVPALVVGGVAIVLLGREQQRIGRAVAEAQSQRAETIADELALAVIEAERRLVEQLEALPAAGLQDALVDWERRNPLVRNVFVWEPPNRLLLPDPSSPATDEQRRFVQRYESLFAGRSAWGDGHGERSESAPTTSSRRSRSSRSRRASRTTSLAELYRPDLTFSLTSLSKWGVKDTFTGIPPPLLSDDDSNPCQTSPSPNPHAPSPSPARTRPS